MRVKELGFGEDMVKHYCYQRGYGNSDNHGPPNAPLKSLLILAAARDIQIVSRWLPSGENTLADALSRNNLQEVANICPHWQDLSVLNHPRGSLRELISSMQAI